MGSEEASSNPSAQRLGLAAIVLAGGASSRMGIPKAWLRFGDEVLLARTVRVLRAVAAPVVVVTAPGRAVPDCGPDVAVLVDEVIDAGPLAGLAVGLRAIAGSAEAAFVCATDAPFLDASFVRRLAEIRGAHTIIAPRVDDRAHPLAAVVSTSALPLIEARLAARELRLRSLLEATDTRYVDAATLLAGDALRVADPGLRSLRNINTPEEYEAAQRELKELQAEMTRSDPRTTRATP